MIFFLEESGFCSHAEGRKVTESRRLSESVTAGESRS